MKRLISISLAICLLLAALPALGEEFVLTGTVVTAVAKIEDAYGKADTKALSELKVGTEIVLNGGTASMLDDDGLTEGSVITITDKGVYRVTGSSENVTLVVSDEAKSGNITLILDNASMTADGTVLASGDNTEGQCDVEEWKDIVAVSSGYWNTAGLKADGTVVLAGHPCDVSSWSGITMASPQNGQNSIVSSTFFPQWEQYIGFPPFRAYGVC